MTSLRCFFTLSLFWCVEPLKKISEWVFLLNGLGLFRTTLCACRSFWGGAENCSMTGKLLWPAHLFRHFLRRVTWSQVGTASHWYSALEPHTECQAYNGPAVVLFSLSDLLCDTIPTRTTIDQSTSGITPWERTISSSICCFLMLMQFALWFPPVEVKKISRLMKTYTSTQ